jgi:hypothetical protein
MKNPGPAESEFAASIAAVVWLEGINDFSKNGNATVEAVEAGMKEVVGRIRAKLADARIIGATVTSALGSTNANHIMAHPSKMPSERRSTISSEPAVCSTGLLISMPRPLTRRPGACAPNSSPKVRRADLVTNSTRIESDICQWAWRSS